MYIPYVIEQNKDGERSYDLFSRLLKDRIVMIQGEIDEQSMNVAVGELLFLNNEDSDKPIYVYINTPGGDVLAGQQLTDIMKYIKAPVYTVCLGMAASMGSVILAAGEKGHRYCMKNSKILVHPMSGGTNGRTNDMVIEVNFEKRLQNVLMAQLAHDCGKLSDDAYNEIYNECSKLTDKGEDVVLKLSKSTKKELDDFKKTNDYDHWMFANEALEFGIVDQILNSESDLDEQ